MTTEPTIQELRNKIAELTIDIAELSMKLSASYSKQLALMKDKENYIQCISFHIDQIQALTKEKEK